MKPVPNQFPASDPGPLRLALIGEAPGADEVAMGYPFAGKSGWALNGFLAAAGLSRSSCFVGNVCQMRPSPTSNDFHLLEWNGAPVQEGIAALREDLAAFRPNIVVALGNAALHLLRHGNAAPPKSKLRGLFQWTSHVGTWRGSLFLAAASFDPFAAADLRCREGRCPAVAPDALGTSNPFGRPPTGAPSPGAQCTATTTDGLLPASPSGYTNASASTPRSLEPPAGGGSPFPAASCAAPPLAAPPLRREGGHAGGPDSLPVASSAPLSPAPYKALSTYHPAATFREPSFTFPLVSDLKRAVAEARSPSLDLPLRDIRWGLSADELESECAAIRAARAPVAHDIEGGLGGLQCASFATSPSRAIVVDLMGAYLDKPRLIAAIASVLEDPMVPKVLWNAAYERAIWQAVHGVTIRNYEDGMLAWWERFSELPKGLDFVASILTREPYWAEGIGWDKRTGLPRVMGAPFWTYNALDSMVTLEIWQSPLIRAVVDSRTPVAFTQ